MDASDDTGAGPDGPVPADPPGLLAAVEDSVLAIVAQAARPPASLRVTAGGVTVEAEWSAAGGGAAVGDGAVVGDGAAAGGGAAVGGGAVTGDGAGHAGPGPAGPAMATPDGASPGPVSGDDVIAARSPSTGVFYRAPSPGDPPFVQVGDVVEAGQQVGVVESMKLFFPVEAGSPGRVVAIKQDGEAVDHGEPLVTVEAAHP